MGAKAIDDGSLWPRKLEGCSLLLEGDQRKNFGIGEDFYFKRQTTKKQR